MKFFKATLRHKGKKETIDIQAEDRNEAIVIIKNKYQGLLLKIEEVEPPLEYKIKEYLKTLSLSSLKRRKLNYEIFISAVRQLATLVKAQISLKDSLENISKNTEDELIQEIFKEAAANIDSGLTLADSFAKYKNEIGQLGIAIIKLGEQTGDLGNALEQLADTYEQIHDNRKKLKKALRYPIFTLIAMGIAFSILMVFVVPKFKDVFKKLNADLPLPTVILLKLEYIFTNFGPLILAMGVIGFFAHKWAYANKPDYKFTFDKYILKIYLIGNIIHAASLSRWTMVMNQLLKAGIPLIDALKISAGVIENAYLASKVESIYQTINSGQSFTNAIEQAGLLDNITFQMVKAGEETGELVNMFGKTYEYYNDKFNYILDNISASIEPIMMAFIGGLVLLMALGIFLPMWNLASAVRQ